MDPVRSSCPNSVDASDIDRDLALRASSLYAELQPLFTAIDVTAFGNFTRVQRAFRSVGVAENDLFGTTGYGYGDSGREKLDAIFAASFRAESALVRSQFVSGTHAIATVLFSLLGAGDSLLFGSGKPYETLHRITGDSKGASHRLSLIGRGILVDTADLTREGLIDRDALLAKVEERPRVCMLQRSRGYSLRPAFSADYLLEVAADIKRVCEETIVFIDNCYGEFVEPTEPIGGPVDLIAGSLIKNPGGGLAPSGGYVAGEERLVAEVADYLIAPGLGGEVGPTLGTNRDYLRGIFMAPSVVGEAVKGSVFASALSRSLGFLSEPDPEDRRHDMVQVIHLGSREALISFCRGLQRSGAVNTHFAPEPSPLPGYDAEIIMASPSFIQGSSVEISCDAPLRPPYVVFLQGGLHIHHSMMGAISGFQRMIEDGILTI